MRQWLPEGIEVLDDAMAVGGGMAMNDAFGDAQGALQPQALASDIGQGEEGFDRVHVAVGATVRLGRLPGTGEGFAEGALRFAPEMRDKHLHRVFQQGGRVGSAGQHRRAGGQGDEGMQVGGLAAVGSAIGVGEPAAMGGVLHGTTQGSHTVFDIGQATGQALQLGQGEAVGHAGGVQGVGTGTGGKLPLGIQAAEAIGQFRSLGERQQALCFGQAPGGVSRGIEPTGGRQVMRIHGPA